ncbi:ABC-type antimicrobial peptide transport system, permease component [Mucilaginibacter pineti]|uniref:ABC-type antimicrobial peptide transport system, permease component n=1 Tax=Mucilaginibacter pineti TaxID=1391627 RepID=A0A1G6ZSG6_9SPHI|nr:ABC transporter permease [Mucilaginibacter pineti]SDE05177.1 ABC-type antimicrobial peptide transport system, permease component [Mucilaginibacter pineti]
MLKNYFKTAWRNLIRNISFSVINILGLAIGMASAILILLWIQNEMSHDQFHEKKDRLYVANNRDKFNGELWAWSTTPKPLGLALKQDYPEVEDAVRVSDFQTFLFTVADKHLNLNGAVADPGFLNMFSFKLISGNTSALSGNNSIVITQKMAIKLFGNEDAMGKVVKIDSTDNFTVTGILKDLPNNTSFNFEYLLPWSYLKKINQDDGYWGNNSIKTFVLLKPGVSQASFDTKVKNITIDHTKNGEKSTTQVFTQLFSDTWLYSKSENGVYVAGRIERVKLFGIIAIFILLIACINFMNLSTARSEKRAKEVGIRKVAGATKESLILQFIGESVMLSFLAGIFAIIIVEISLHGFNQLVGKRLFIDFSNPSYWLFAILFILFTGLLAGSYPAFYLSSYQPVKVLKGTFVAVNALVTPRKVLVVLQFFFAIFLVICTIIVEHQINYAQARDTGYSRNNLIYVNMQGDVAKNYDLIKQDLINKSAAIAVTKSMSPITQRYSDGWGFSWPGSTEADHKVDFIRMASDADFVKTMGVKLAEGRDIDIKKYPADSTALMLNETAVKVMRLKNPIGAIVKSDGRDWHVVGVVKDFIYESPYEKVSQMVIQGPKAWFNIVHIKLNPAHSIAKNIDIVNQVFKQYNPQYPFEFKFVDEQYAAKFEDENRVGTLAALFAGLTVFISCLGLFGLATYVAENRIKEIGVRKVLGASVASITTLLSIDFLKLVVISYIIASPIAWFAMNKWLQAYTYRIHIEWWVFALAGILSVVIAIGTISFQSIKAALSNPVKSLRT